MLKSRRGEEEEDGTFNWLLIMILFIVIAAILFLLFKGIYQGGEQYPGEQQCRSSILLHSKTIALTAGDFSSDIACSPVNITVDAADTEQAKGQLAEAMKFCWDRWQRGQLELFQADGIYCNPCAFITFKQHSRLIQGFDQYLVDTPVPSSSIRYAEYFANVQTKGASPNTVPRAGLNGTPTTISTDTDMVVFFLYAKGASVQRIKENFGQNPSRNVKRVATMASVGAVVGGVTFIVATGGAGLIPITIAGIAGGTIGGVGEYLYGSAEKPEWVSLVVLQPNDASALSQFACQYVTQQGVGSGAVRDV